MDDLWEFDVVKALAGKTAFSQLSLSPEMETGMGGMSIATLPPVDSRVLVLGGSSDQLKLQNFLRQLTPGSSSRAFQFGNLESTLKI